MSLLRSCLCLLGWWRGQESHQSWQSMVTGECTCNLSCNNLFRSTILTSITIKIRHKSSPLRPRRIQQSNKAFGGAWDAIIAFEALEMAMAELCRCSVELTPDDGKGSTERHQTPCRRSREWGGGIRPIVGLLGWCVGDVVANLGRRHGSIAFFLRLC